jgi:hypothetical protein
MKVNEQLGIIFPKDGMISVEGWHYFDAITGLPVEDVTVTEIRVNSHMNFDPGVKVVDVDLKIRIVTREDIIDGEAYPVQEYITDPKTGGRLLNWPARRLS